MSDGIDQRYKQMLEDQDADNSVLLEQEESKTVSHTKDMAGPTSSSHYFN